MKAEHRFTNLAIISLIEYKDTGNIDLLNKAQQLIGYMQQESNQDQTWQREVV